MDASRRHWLSGPVKLAYGFGAVAAGVFDSAFNIFLLFFYQQIAGLDPALCGLALFLSLCIDAVVDPSIGAWSDRLRTRFGRRHPLMYGAIAPLALAFYAVFVPPAGLAELWLFAWLLGFASLARISLALFMIPYLALAPQLFPSSSGRAALNNLSTTFSWLSGLTNTLLGYLVFLPSSARYTHGLLNPAGYPRLALFGAVAMVTGMLVCALGTQRAARAIHHDADRAPAVGLRQLPRAIADVLQSRSYRAALGAGLTSSVAFGLTEQTNNYVNAFFWGLSSEQVAAFVWVIFLAAFIVMWKARRTLLRFGSKHVAIGAGVVRTLTVPTFIALELAGVLPGPGHPLRFPVLAFAVLLGYGAVIASATAQGTMMADLTDEYELRSGSRQEGLMFAANMFISKAVSGLGLLSAGLLLRVAHFPENAKPGEVDPQVVADLAIYVALALFSLGALLIFFLTRYPLDRATHARTVRLLTAREAERMAAIAQEAMSKTARLSPELIAWLTRSAPPALDDARTSGATMSPSRTCDALPATSVATEADPFDALLREAARASAPARAARNLLPAGTALAGGRLSVLRRIGEGGMGVVYEAVDAERKTRVALKTLTRIDAAGVYRLKNEFRALADVRHENLIGLHELFSAEQGWFFTMDLVDGERFDHWVRPPERANGTAVDLGRLHAAFPQLVAAVSAVHAAGKLHRDLKPSNVLCTIEGRVVVLDFGLSVEPELGGVGQTVADESVSGTPGYMAPEQAAGQPATTASDYYALGVMLFEALTGRLPFEGRSAAIVAAKQTQEAPRASAFAADVPAELDQLCAGLLAREPQARSAAITRCLELTAGTRVERASAAPPQAEPGSQLLGRDAELAALRAAFEVSLGGQAVLIFVSGESGIGKSALVHAALDELRREGRATVIAGRCYERENVPYKGFDALVDELSRHLRKLSGQEAAALLPREVFALARIFPVLDRVPVVAEAPRKHVPDPQDLKQRAFAAFGELLTRMRDRAPLVLVIDDLQWIDEDSTRFMRSLLAQSDPPPLLVVAVHRSEGAADNPRLQSVLQAARSNAALRVEQLALPPLARPALVELARRLLPDGSDAHAADAFAAEAHGSPFFAIELARAATLEPLSGAKLSLEQALAVHVASLPPEAQRLLALLALAGQPLAAEVAIEAANLSDGHAQLDRLRGEQLVRSAFDADGKRRVECYHDKIREQVAAGLDSLRNRELALGLSRALLQNPSADLELLARVLTLAGLPAEAAVHAGRAAERAFASLAFERAAALFEQALAHGAFEPERLHALRVGRAEALAHAGFGLRAAEAFLESTEGASEDEAFELTRKAGEHYVLCGELTRGRAVFAQVCRQAGIYFPQSLWAALLCLIGSRARLALRGLRYTPSTQHSVATLRKLELLRTIAHGLSRTDQLRAVDFSARSLVCALDAGHEVEIARALAWEWLWAYAIDRSEHVVEQMRTLCARLCERTKDPFASRLFLNSTGVAGLVRGYDAAAMVHLMDQALAIGLANPHPLSAYDMGWVRHFRYDLCFALGRIGEVSASIDAALEQAVARGDHTLTVPLANIALHCYLAADRPEEAARLREAVAGWYRSEEPSYTAWLWIIWEYMPALYVGRARDAWYGQVARRTRFAHSFDARAFGRAFGAECGLAVAAARQATSGSERNRLARAARWLAYRRTLGGVAAFDEHQIAAALACLRGDRDGAVASLSEGLRHAITTPYWGALVQRRLGLLLDDDEGAALVAGADAYLRAAGVVDVERYVAMRLPGLELPPRNTSGS